MQAAAQPGECGHKWCNKDKELGEGREGKGEKGN